jgi:hypothetical protein
MTAALLLAGVTIAILLLVVLLLWRRERECPPCTLVSPATTPSRITVAIDHNSGAPVHFPQIGYLTGEDGTPTPLYGQESAVRRNRYRYYVVRNGVKLQIVSKRRGCLDELACEELYDGDTVSVDGGAGVSVVKLYDRNTLL